METEGGSWAGAKTPSTCLPIPNTTQGVQEVHVSQKAWLFPRPTQGPDNAELASVFILFDELCSSFPFRFIIPSGLQHIYVLF